jgi:hypothetical protein
MMVLTFLMCFFPLWMGLTYTSENPGLQGYFYYYYIAIGFFKLLIGAGCVWMVTKAPAGSSKKNSSISNPKSSERKDSFPSYTVEDLAKIDTSTTEMVGV